MRRERVLKRLKTNNIKEILIKIKINKILNMKRQILFCFRAVENKPTKPINGKLIAML